MQCWDPNSEGHYGNPEASFFHLLKLHIFVPGDIHKKFSLSYPMSYGSSMLDNEHQAFAPFLWLPLVYIIAMFQIASKFFW